MARSSTTTALAWAYTRGVDCWIRLGDWPPTITVETVATLVSEGLLEVKRGPDPRHQGAPSTRWRLTERGHREGRPLVPVFLRRPL